MAVKEKEIAVKEVKPLLPEADVHHIVRTIGIQATPDGAITGAEADNYLRGWLQSGYRLAFVEAMGMVPNGVNVLYILIKDA